MTSASMGRPTMATSEYRSMPENTTVYNYIVTRNTYYVYKKELGGGPGKCACSGLPGLEEEDCRVHVMMMMTC